MFLIDQVFIEGKKVACKAKAHFQDEISFHTTEIKWRAPEVM